LLIYFTTYRIFLNVPRYIPLNITSPKTPGLGLGETEAEGLILADGDTLGEMLGLTEGDTLAEGETLGEILGLTDGDSLADGLTLGLILALGEIDGEIDGETDGLTLALGEIDGETLGLTLGETLALGETDREPVEGITRCRERHFDLCRGAHERVHPGQRRRDGEAHEGQQRDADAAVDHERRAEETHGWAAMMSDSPRDRWPGRPGHAARAPGGLRVA